MRLIAVAMTAVSLLLFTYGLVRAVPEAPGPAREVGENLPTISPDLIWEQQLPGHRRAGSPNPKAPIRTELGRAIQALSAGWPPTGYQTDWTGTPGLVTHLSPPGEAPRAIFWLSDGHLYLVEKTQAEWQTRRLTDSYADVTAVVDLSGRWPAGDRRRRPARIWSHSGTAGVGLGQAAGVDGLHPQRSQGAGALRVVRCRG
jgi:hypothetical protein